MTPATIEHFGEAVLRTGFVCKRPSFHERSQDRIIRYLTVGISGESSIGLMYIEKGKRKKMGFVMQDNRLSFAMLIVSGEIVWDTRVAWPVYRSLEEMTERLSKVNDDAKNSSSYKSTGAAQ